jgi:hypothetical protein
MKGRRKNVAADWYVVVRVREGQKFFPSLISTFEKDSCYVSKIFFIKK